MLIKITTKRLVTVKDLEGRLHKLLPTDHIQRTSGKRGKAPKTFLLRGGKQMAELEHEARVYEIALRKQNAVLVCGEVN
jgi:hypothetical protein